MLDNDLFAALRSGAKFDNKRFQKDIEKFKPKRTESTTAVASAAASKNSDAALDFFGNHTVEPAQHESSRSSSHKRKETEEEHARKGKGKDEKGNTQGDESDDEEDGAGAAGGPVTDAAALRQQMRISVSGTDIPDPAPTFEDMPMHPKTRRWITRNVDTLGWENPTAIQMQSIPIILSGRDMIGAAPTGSGKTAAFVIPIFALLKEPERTRCRAVIVSPTRELASQIHRQSSILGDKKKFRIKLLTKATAAAVASETSSCDLLITTPMRLVANIQERTMDLSNVRIICFDEADRLFDNNFVKQVDEVLAACSNPKLQKVLFSATLPPVVEDLAKSAMRDAINVTVGSKNTASSNVEQKLQFVSNEEGKLLALRQMIQEGIEPPVLIFVQSVDRAKQLFKELVFEGVNVDAIHSERTQSQRDNVIHNFRTGKVWVLIATELLGRGMDFKGVHMVINYDFPQTVFSYIHRVGRTGRAGRAGKAVTLFTKEDAPFLRSIANVVKQSGGEVPDWMLKMKKISKDDRRHLAKAPPERADISHVPAFDKQRRNNRQQAIETSKRRKLEQQEADSDSD